MVDAGVDELLDLVPRVREIVVAQDQLDRSGDLVGLATDIRAVLVEHGVGLAELLRRPGRAVQTSACSATTRRVSFRPAPPIVIGGCGRWTGFGSHTVPRSW
ncbi:MAG TPA: hypothetical protein VFI65_22810 [Streptosporangiaceae bacterium]|nr:hypothetical protein [Streptosporangiaceae bacterium]